MFFQDRHEWQSKMGKKDRNGEKRKRMELEKAEDELNGEEDPELEAEIQAVMAARAEEEAEANGTADAVVKRPRGINNKEGLEQALGGLETTNLPFIESYQVCEFDLEVPDENDDLEREMAFYQQSLQAVESGRNQLKKLGVPTRRPEDYFAENLKTDAHMGRIKDKLLLEQKKMDSFEKRQQREQNVKYNKQVMEMRKREKMAAAKEDTDEITKLRKGGAKGEELDERIEKIIGRGQGERGKDEKSFKRKGMDKKYGSGVRDKMRGKLNDKKSLNDMTDYNPRGGKEVRRNKPGGGVNGGRGGTGKPSGGGGGGSKGSSSSRPGKSRRDAKRSKP